MVGLSLSPVPPFGGYESSRLQPLSGQIPDGPVLHKRELPTPFHLLTPTPTPTLSHPHKGVGKLVMRAAADNLTPVVLELGGKDPFVVAEGVCVLSM